MTTVNLIAPAGVGQTLINCLSGVNYQTDANGYVSGVALADAGPLISQGWQVYNSDPAYQLIGMLKSANMNVTTDQAIPLVFRSPATAKIRPTKITVNNASISLTTAAGGVYTAASKGGTAIVANSQAYSALSSGALSLDLTLAVAEFITQPVNLYLSLTTAQGAAATADFYVFGDLYG